MANPRRRLHDLELTGVRRAIQTLIVASLVASGAVTTVGFALGRHRVARCWDCSDFGPWHSYVAELYGIPVAVPAAAAALALYARRRVPWGPLVGLAHVFVGIGVIALVFATHLLDSTDDNLAGIAGILGLLAMVASGLIATVALPLLAVLERRRLERGDPVFAEARVVRR